MLDTSDIVRYVSIVVDSDAVPRNSVGKHRNVVSCRPSHSVEIKWIPFLINSLQRILVLRVKTLTWWRITSWIASFPLLWQTSEFVCALGVGVHVEFGPAWMSSGHPVVEGGA